jgi:hypothetical protein
MIPSQRPEARNAAPERDPDGLQGDVTPHASKVIQEALVEFSDEVITVEVLQPLNARQLRFVEAVTRYGSVAAASREVGLSVATGYTWWNKNPSIRRAVVLCRQRMTLAVVNTLELAAAMGARELVNVLAEDSEATTNQRLKAAKMALDFSLKIKDLDIEAKIDALQQQMEALQR